MGKVLQVTFIKESSNSIIKNELVKMAMIIIIYFCFGSQVLNLTLSELTS